VRLYTAGQPQHALVLVIGLYLTCQPLPVKESLSEGWRFDVERADNQIKYSVLPSARRSTG
jgi:hypothetical protein